MNKLTLLLLSILLVCGCSSTPETVEYYTLSQPAPGEKSAQQGQGKPLVVIQSVQLAEYLRQQGLVMQPNPNQMQFSDFHRWAEKLDQMILRSLQAQLETARPDYRFENYQGRWQQAPAMTLQLEVTHFHVNAQSETVAAGHYWLFDSEGKLAYKATFDYRQGMAASGYITAVNQLDLSLQKLVSEISAQLPQR